jgi:hypothetical protein
MRVGKVLALALLALTLGCQALADPGIEYLSCLPERDGKYQETFEPMEPRTAVDHCWKTDNVRARGFIHTDDSGDLIIHPPAGMGGLWLETEQAPFFFQTVTGNFLAVTRAEAVSGSNAGDHCGEPNFAAGLAVRKPDGSAWSTLLVQPNFDKTPAPDECGDDVDPPPAARVSNSSFGFGAADAGPEFPVGADGEAYIAVCRAENQLSFYRQAKPQRIADSTTANFLPVFPSFEVDYGPLDVGVTATSSANATNLAEGHFSWLTLADYPDPRIVGDGCNGMLENFEFPEDD